MFSKHIAISILIFSFYSTPAWSGGNKYHEIKDLFETIRGKVFGSIIENKENSSIEITNQVSNSECSSPQADENSPIENLSSEWKFARPKNLEAELPKVCLIASAHITKNFCPTELRTQFEFNFFIDVTDCFNVPQKQVLMNLYSLANPVESPTDKFIWTASERSSCQRIQTLLQVLDDGVLKTHITNLVAKVSSYSLAQQELQKYIKTKRLAEETAVLWSLVAMKSPQKINELRFKNTRMPAQTKKQPEFKLDKESQEWIDKVKESESKLNTILGNGVCTMSSTQ